MRLLKRLTHPDGKVEVTLNISSAEDLWHLYNFVVPGDVVRTRTRRKVVKENSMGVIDANIKLIHLSIDVKSVHFSPDEMRVHGVNIAENEFVRLGAYHTLVIQHDSPQTVSIVKAEWSEIQDERLREACNQEGRADTLALLMSPGEMQLVVVTSSFIHVKAKVAVTIAKKHKNDGTARDKSIQKFFGQVLNALKTNVDLDKVRLILLCSPGTVREEFMTYLRNACQTDSHEQHGSLQQSLSKFVLVKVNTASIGGLREAMNDPTVSAKMESTRCASDIKVWDKFQSTMNHDPDRCVYTPQYVFYAAMSGAVAALMISDAVFRDSDPVVRHFFLSLVHFVKRGGGATVHVFSSHHVTGEQLTQLGHVAAILHFACPELDEMDVCEDFVHSAAALDFVSKHASRKVVV